MSAYRTYYIVYMSDFFFVSFFDVMEIFLQLCMRLFVLFMLMHKIPREVHILKYSTYMQLNEFIAHQVKVLHVETTNNK